LYEFEVKLIASACDFVLDGTCPKGWLAQQDVVCVGRLCYVVRYVTSSASTCLLVCLSVCLSVSHLGYHAGGRLFTVIITIDLSLYALDLVRSERLMLRVGLLTYYSLCYTWTSVVRMALA